MAPTTSAEVTPLFASSSTLNRRHQNHLLATLPLADRERFVSRCQRLTYKPREVLYPQHGAITHLYFPVTGLISLVLSSENGASIEVGLVGNEGMAGLPAFLGSWKSPTLAVWQVAGEAFRIAANDFVKELDRTPSLRSHLGRYAQALTHQTMQFILCNNFHAVDQRLCRWLLMTHDRLGVDELPLTQQFLAQMLGIRRPSVTVAVGMLQKAGIVSCRRGQIRMADRSRMEKAACECYEAVRREFESLLSSA